MGLCPDYRPGRLFCPIFLIAMGDDGSEPIHSLPVCSMACVISPAAPFRPGRNLSVLEHADNFSFPSPPADFGTKLEATPAAARQ